jgi:predicted nucleic-acid-binding protein
MNTQKNIILDTNAIVRYIVKDNRKQLLIVEKIVENNSLLILPEVIAEVIYILCKFYKMTRNIASNNILQFLEDIDSDDAILSNALKTFGKNKLDFVDCLLLHHAKQGNNQVFTFDEKLNKLIDKI